MARSTQVMPLLTVVILMAISSGKVSGYFTTNATYRKEIFYGRVLMLNEYNLIACYDCVTVDRERNDCLEKLDKAPIVTKCNACYSQYEKKATNEVTKGKS